MTDRIYFMLNGEDITGEIGLKNGRSNPFGWSQHEVHHQGQRIGWIECGAVTLNADGYTYRIESDDA